MFFFSSHQQTVGNSSTISFPASLRCSQKISDTTPTSSHSYQQFAASHAFLCACCSTIWGFLLCPSTWSHGTFQDLCMCPALPASHACERSCKALHFSGLCFLPFFCHEVFRHNFISVFPIFNLHMRMRRKLNRSIHFSSIA